MIEDFQPHDHIAKQYGHKTGSPYQTFPRPRRKGTPWLWFSTSVTVAVFLGVLCALPWEGGW
jgi:hypothetical protein